MYKIKLLSLLLLFKTYQCQDINKFFETINDDYAILEAISANISWDSAIDPSPINLQTRDAHYQKTIIKWQHRTCDRLNALNNIQSLNSTQQRQTYLLCSGPKFTYSEARLTSKLYDELQSIYSEADICVPINVNITINNLGAIEDAILKYLCSIKKHSQNGDSILFAAKVAVNEVKKDNNRICLRGEDDFQKIMAFSKNEDVLRWIWLVWREKVGPPMKEPYRRLVNVQNGAARRNGYANIGASWRDELEIPDLRQFCRSLLKSIRPIYKLLHGVVRFHLRKYYGNVVPERGPIPAHLLGNLWSQNWESLSDLILPNILNLDGNIMKLNWTVSYMVKRAEDFYQSLGLPAMTDAFWRHSVFTRENRKSRCHGTAADMFKDGDFRLLYCSETTMDDFYVLHHELGHIQYYMAYKNQPTIFRQANAAFQEAIGDTIMCGVMTPQHLNRLGLINDSVLFGINITLSDDANNLLEFNNKHYKKKQKDRDTGSKVNKGSVINKQIYNKLNPFNTNNIHTMSKRKTSGHYKETDNLLQFNYEARVNDDDFIISTKAVDKVSKDNQTFIYNEGTYQKDKHNNGKLATEIKPSLKITIDDILLLKQALNRLPQMPFALLMDEYRWKYFEGDLKEINEEFWQMALELQGIAPPGIRGEEYFDIGAKFHIPDNTPYIRYFLSGFIQYQLYETLCKAAVFGRRNVDETLPETISMNRCDIYGSRTVGKILKDFMSRGNSQHWRDILEAATGQRDISAAALQRYYRPLFQLLKKIVRAYRIPIGW